MLTEEAIHKILTKYQVRNHYKASAAGKKTVYAVWAEGLQVTKPESHGDAQRAMRELIVEDIMKLSERG